jgi:hypothetical protein
MAEALHAIHGPVQRAETSFGSGGGVGTGTDLICDGNHFIEFLCGVNFFVRC